MKSFEDITPTPLQQEVLRELYEFVESEDERVFILRGYAGTGKTTMMRFLVKELKGGEKIVRLLASTGRAAKVLSDLVEEPKEKSDTGEEERLASTIHSMIYSFKGLNKDLSEKEKLTADETGQLLLMFEMTSIDPEKSPDFIYIVDEASMVSDKASSLNIQAEYGSGRLLKDLLEYDRKSRSKFIFVGDPCQLPPIEQYFSPALLPEYFQKVFGLRTRMRELTEIIRQEDGSSIIEVSKKVREFHSKSPADETGYTRVAWGRIPFRGHDDIILHPSESEMLMQYVREVQEHGIDRSICICYSNKRAWSVSQWVRRQLNRPPERLVPGDILMVIQNNKGLDLMNGDFVVVEEVMGEERMVANLKFRKVKVREMYSNRTCTTLLMDDLLYQPRPNLDERQQTNLFLDFVIRMKKLGITQKKKKAFNDAMLIDPYLNALRCVYGYAVTCHKAQGGEWDDVYIDFPRNITKNPTKGKWQWIYTAMTRAKERIHAKDDFYFN